MNVNKLHSFCPYRSHTLSLLSLSLACVCVASVCRTALNLLITYTQPLDNLLTTRSCDLFLRSEVIGLAVQNRNRKWLTATTIFPSFCRKMLSARVLIIRMLTVPSDPGDSGGKGQRLKRESSPVMLKLVFNDDIVLWCLGKLVMETMTFPHTDVPLHKYTQIYSVLYPGFQCLS